MRWLLAISVLSLFTACAHNAPPAPATPVVAAAPPAASAPNREPTTVEGCTACGGEWAVHGLVGAQQGTMSCLCPTADAGKRCRDGAECQGECVTDGAEHEVTAAGPPALGFFVGKCSRFHTTYGCHRVIATGALQAGPVPLDQPPTEICTD